MYNNKGSTKPACNDITRDIWLWCLERHNFVSAVHIPGSTYIEAEFESRVDRHEIEWRLDERFSRVLWGSFVDVTLICLLLEWMHSWNHMFLGDQIQMLWLLMSSFWIGPNLELFVFLLSVWYQRCCRRWICLAECVIVVPFRTTQVWFTKLLNFW